MIAHANCRMGIVMKVIITFVVLVFMNCGFGQVSKKTDQLPPQVSEWVGKYEGTARFVAQNWRSGKNRERWDSRKVKENSLEGTVLPAYLSIEPYGDSLQLELLSDFSDCNVKFHLEPDLFFQSTARFNKHASNSFYRFDLVLTGTALSGMLQITRTMSSSDRFSYPRGHLVLNVTKVR